MMDRRWIGTLGVAALAFMGGLIAGHAAPARAAYSQGMEAERERAAGEPPDAHRQLFVAGYSAGAKQALRDVGISDEPRDQGDDACWGVYVEGYVAGRAADESK